MENLVFCSKTNKPIHEANVRSAIRYVVAKINRENPELDFQPFTPHGLRHTFATKAIAKGMRPKHYRKCYLYCRALESFYSFFMEKTRVYDTISINERRISIPPLQVRRALNSG